MMLSLTDEKDRRREVDVTGARKGSCDGDWSFMGIKTDGREIVCGVKERGVGGERQDRG